MSMNQRKCNAALTRAVKKLQSGNLNLTELEQFALDQSTQLTLDSIIPDLEPIELPQPMPIELPQPMPIVPQNNLVNYQFQLNVSNPPNPDTKQIELDAIIEHSKNLKLMKENNIKMWNDYIEKYYS